MSRQTILSAFALTLSLASTASGSDLGYWTCEKGEWAAVGHPSYDPPLRVCGDKPGLPDDIFECRRAGGIWGPIGLFPSPVCRMPANDADRVCGDADECESTCLATLSEDERDHLMKGGSVHTLGTCAPVYPIVGCLAVVRHGAVDGLLCLD